MWNPKQKTSKLLTITSKKILLSTTNISKEIAPTLLFVTISCSRVHELGSNRNRKEICWVLDENTLNKLIVVASDIYWLSLCDIASQMCTNTKQITLIPLLYKLISESVYSWYRKAQYLWNKGCVWNPSL